MTRCFAALAIAMLLGAAGCEATPETQVREFCAHACGCRSSLPSVIDLCVDDCVDDSAGASDEQLACLRCLTAVACDGDPDACDLACDFNDPLTSRQEIR